MLWSSTGIIMRLTLFFLLYSTTGLPWKNWIETIARQHREMRNSRATTSSFAQCPCDNSSQQHTQKRDVSFFQFSMLFELHCVIFNSDFTMPKTTMMMRLDLGTKCLCCCPFFPRLTCSLVFSLSMTSHRRHTKVKRKIIRMKLSIVCLSSLSSLPHATLNNAFKKGKNDDIAP